MKHFFPFPTLLPIIAALFLGPLAVHAFSMPAASPLPKSVALNSLWTGPQNALVNSDWPALQNTPVSPLAFSLNSPFATLNKRPIWNRIDDPSLRLADWRHVFDIAALGAFDVPLRSDPAERINILLAAQSVDNVTVAPGEEFSFNAEVGERTLERGYQEGLMFDNGRVIRGTGGGICLVATGLYNAALSAGLPITERHPHSGLVSYAAPGCDAGIVYGQEDFKFRNTTGKPIVIRAEAEDDHIAVHLFGHTPLPGRQVIVKPLSLTRIPYAVITKTDPALPVGQSVVDQKPHSGYDVVLARFWTVKGRVVRREIVANERRAPRNKVVRVALPPVLPNSLLSPFLPGQTVPTDGIVPVAGASGTDTEPGD